MNLYVKIIIITAILSSAVVVLANQQPEIQIPRSVPGDKGKYFLLEKIPSGDIVKVLHKRVGVDSVGYTKTEINCKTMQIRDIGYSEESPATIKENPTKWYELIPGSSKSDLANFVCKQEKK